MSVLFKLLLSYLESHPDQVTALIEEGVQALIRWLKAKNALAA